MFKRFIDSSFSEIRKKAVNKLVIDLRQNRGGSQSSSIHLLQYLVNQPFTYYSNAQFEGKRDKNRRGGYCISVDQPVQGKTYFIIDAVWTWNDRSLYVNCPVSEALEMIVGEELGSNQFCSAGYDDQETGQYKTGLLCGE